MDASVLSSPAAVQGYQFDKIEQNRRPNGRSLVLVRLQPQKKLKPACSGSSPSSSTCLFYRPPSPPSDSCQSNCGKLKRCVIIGLAALHRLAAPLVIHRGSPALALYFITPVSLLASRLPSPPSSPTLSQAKWISLSPLAVFLFFPITLFFLLLFCLRISNLFGPGL